MVVLVVFLRCGRCWCSVFSVGLSCLSGNVIFLCRESGVVWWLILSVSNCMWGGWLNGDGMNFEYLGL